MSIFNRREKAKDVAAKYAAKYNIQYNEDGDTFSMYGKDDASETAFRNRDMVDSDRWITRLSPRRQKITAEYERLAQIQNLETIKKTQNEKDASILSLQQQLLNEQKKNRAVNMGEEIVGGTTVGGGTTKLKPKINTNISTDITNNKVPIDHYSSDNRWVSSPTISSDNKIVDKIVDREVEREIAKDNVWKWTIPSSGIKDKKERGLFLSPKAMIAFDKNVDGKYHISTNEFFAMDPNKLSLKIDQIPIYKSTKEALEDIGLEENWSEHVSDSPIFRVGKKYYNLNEKNAAVEIDPVITKLPSVWGGNQFKTGRLMLNKNYDITKIYSKLREIKAYKKRLKFLNSQEKKDQSNYKIRKLDPKY